MTSSDATRPDPDEPHAIADTQMFRRFVDEAPQAAPESRTGLAKLWVWPGLLIPTLGSRWWWRSSSRCSPAEQPPLSSRR